MHPWVLLVICLWGEVRSNSVEIKTFENNPGVYYEGIGRMHITKDTWNLAVQLDMRAYKENRQQIQNYIEKIIIQCNKTGLNEVLPCRTLRGTTQQIMRSISKKFKGIRELIGIQETTSKLEKRGLINGIGSIAKTLFGTMDYDDANKIEQRLGDIENKNNVIKGAVLKQTQIIKTALNIFNDTMKVIEKNEKRLVETIQRVNATIGIEIKSLVILQELDEHVLFVMELLNKLQEKIDDLMNYIIDLRLGIVNPSILTLSEIMQNLKESLPHLPQGMNLPISLTAQDHYLLSRIIDLQAFYKDNVITTVIEIPLVRPDVFTVNRIHLLPYKTNQTVYAFPDIRSTHAIIDSTYKEYIEITESELARCKIIIGQRICKSSRPIQRINRNSPCEIRMVVERRYIPETCSIRLIPMKQAILIDLETPGIWLFVAPEPVPITILCEDKMVEHIEIHGTGRLQVKGKCVVTGKDFKIETTKAYMRKVVQDYLPPINMTVNFTNSHIIHSEVLFNKSIHLKSVIKHSSELLDASNELRNIETDIKSLNEKGHTNMTHTLTTYSIQAFTIIVITIIIVIILKLYASYKGRSVLALSGDHPEAEAIQTPEISVEPPVKRQRMFVSFQRNTLANRTV